MGRLGCFLSTYFVNGARIFSLSHFWGGREELFLSCGLQKEPTRVRLCWPTTTKIDSDGIWWLTHCLSPEEKKKMGEGKNNTRKKQEDSHTLTSYTQGWAPMHLPSGGQRELRWKKKTPWNTFTLSGYHSHTGLRKADAATWTLPLIILFTSLLDLKATGPLPRKQEELRQRGSRQLSDGLLEISTVFGGSLTARKRGLFLLCRIQSPRHEPGWAS